MGGTSKSVDWEVLGELWKDKVGADGGHSYVTQGQQPSQGGEHFYSVSNVHKTR